MKWTARIWFTARQKAELRKRWKSAQCVAAIARALGRRNRSGVYRILALDGGIAPNTAPRAFEVFSDVLGFPQMRKWRRIRNSK
jgi:hypothetical protein